MPFDPNDLPKWNATGAEPPDDRKDKGWGAGEKPPADWFDWLFNKAFKSLQSLFTNAQHREEKGKANGYAALDANGKVVNADGSSPGGVQSVNNKTGTVNLSAGDVGAYSKTEIDGMKVVSYVNGKTGSVTLGSADINKIAAQTVDALPAVYDDGYSVFSLSASACDAWKTSTGHTGSVTNALVETIKITGVYTIIQRITFQSTDINPVISGVYERSSSANNSWKSGWNKVVSRDEFATHMADNVSHITAAERTSWNGKETPSGAQSKADQAEMNLNKLRKRKSNKDSNGIYTSVEYVRTDGTLYAKSTLSGGTSPQYTTNTVTYYKLDGTTVLSTDSIPLTYDADGDLQSEV